jgi:transketolase
MQSMGTCEETIELLDLAKKWEAFGWNTVEVDGHNHTELKAAFEVKTADKPVCIVAHTVKGKGVSFMENNILWHYRDPQGDLFDSALAELEKGAAR